jgi:hypothetical protein
MTNKTIVLQSSDNYFDGIITSTNYDYVDSYYDESNKLSNNSSKSWSIFDRLKFDVIDNYLNYIMSAGLQTCALLIVILSLII